MPAPKHPGSMTIGSPRSSFMYLPSAYSVPTSLNFTSGRGDPTRENSECSVSQSLCSFVISCCSLLRMGHQWHGRSCTASTGIQERAHLMRLPLTGQTRLVAQVHPL